MRRRMLAGLALVLLVIGAAPTKAPPPKPLPIVTVTKTDGTLVKGQIIVSDPDQVTVKPSIKAGQTTPGEDVVIPWTEIKTISNGLTQKKVLEQWKTEHAKDLCETCGGDRWVTCSTCKGTGHDPKSSKDCKTCSGAQEIKCKAPRCKEGKTPCPKPCLKLTEGRWVKRDDGLLWREFPGRNGGGGSLISERHLGQLIVYDENGVAHPGEQCPTCGGKGAVNCSECRGTAKAPCPTCKAKKDAVDCAECEGGAKKCGACGGTGLKNTSAS